LKYSRPDQLILSALLVLLFSLPLLSQNSPSQQLKPTGYLNDFANVVDPAAAQQIETILTNLKSRADIEFAVVTIKTTGGMDIFDYSLDLARGWGIGSKEGEKNGLLLLVAVEDRKYFIQVSRHLEGDLPDGLVGEIGRRMRQPFRAGDYGEGLMVAVQSIVATLSEKRGFSIEGIDQSYAYRPESTQTQKSRPGFSSCMMMLFFLVLLVIIFSGRGRGGGCLNLFLLGSILNSGNRGYSSGWGGGGFGGSSGGWGGFGGGGSFGGGGAGGDW
jgi:uncharacterized protein